MIWLVGFDSNPYASASPALIWFLPLALPIMGVGLAAGACLAANHMLVKSRVTNRTLQAAVVAAAGAAGAFLAYFIVTFGILTGLGSGNPEHLAVLSAACTRQVMPPSEWFSWLLCSVGGTISVVAVAWLSIVGVFAYYWDKHTVSRLS